MRISLPRWDKDSIIGHEQLNMLAEAIERADSLQFDESSGLQTAVSRVGRFVSYVGGGDGVLAYFILSQALPGGSNTSLGHGKGKKATFMPGSGTSPGSLQVASDATDEDIFNLVSGIKSGSTILAGKVDGNWQYLVTLCTNAS